VSLSKFKQAAALRPMLNVGCLFDIPSGRYYPGKNGESILNGGLANFSGFVGMPNMFKTALSLYQLGCVLNRYSSSNMAANDTENTLSVERIMEHLSQFENLENTDLVEQGRLAFSDATVYVGNEWFEDLKSYSKERRDDPSNRLTTPFWNHREGKHLKIPSPSLVFLDSLSGLNTEAVGAMYDKAEIGESGLNMVAMRGAAAKSQMIDQMTGVTVPGGIYALMTAHVGQEHQLDPYKPNPRRLKFLKQGEKIKKIPENFMFLVGTCYQATHLEVMLDNDKKPEFPRNAEDDLKGDTDLILITVMTLRCKTGPSGVVTQVVVSQSEGVKVGLTEYNHLKVNNYYGLSDNNGNMAKGKPNYRVDLLPDITLSRKTIRSKIDESSELRRALTITSEMCQMKYTWHHLEEGVLCTPKELYEDIKTIGYDWSILLNTRGYWTFEEDNHPLPFLSTMDLLRMRLGLYHPKWYPKKREELNFPKATLAEAQAGTENSLPMTPARVAAAVSI
jgi:hypothetical protein